MSTQTHERSTAIQPVAVSFVIGLILPTVFTGGLTLTVALIIAITAMILWVLRMVERTDRALFLPVLALLLGILLALGLGALDIPVGIAVLFLFLFVLFA